MRMRKKKHGAERLQACAHLLCEKPVTPIADSTPFFGKGGKLWLEIGCGKGGFACGIAAANPDVCFIGLEKISDVMVCAAEKALACADTRPQDNLRFIVADASLLGEWFEAGSLDGIFLNFSDPWPKKGHAKRRLTYRGFLTEYFRLLKPNGFLRLKTDNVGLFDFTLEELEALGYTCEWVTRDLHNSVYNEGNVMTEYERNFSEKGMAIHSLLVRKSAE